MPEILHDRVIKFSRGRIATDAPVQIGFRQCVEPATADAELLYEGVIVFRPK